MKPAHLLDPTIYHVTPITPGEQLDHMGLRNLCINWNDPRDLAKAHEMAPMKMLENGKFKLWQDAMKAGKEWHDGEWDQDAYFAWVEEHVFQPGAWAVIPDSPGAPSQVNDGLLNDWPFGRTKGAPLWHMDGPLDRLLRLCERYDRVYLGWIGRYDPAIRNIAKEERKVGCEAWFRRMDEVAALLGNHWPVLHMMRGVLVAREYPFDSADSSSLAKNGHRYDSSLEIEHRFAGRNAYADALERGDFARHVQAEVRRNRDAARRGSCAPSTGQPGHRDIDQLGLWRGDGDFPQPCSIVS